MATWCGSTSRARPAAWTRRINIKRGVGLACGALLAALLACGRGSQDIQATVNAVNTAVERTLVALTQPAGLPTATRAPSTTPIGIATKAPTPTNFVPPTLTSPAPTAATPTVATPAPGATATAVSRPNGALIHAVHVTQAPAIDAQADDWPGGLPNRIDQIVFQPPQWLGEADQSANFGVAWDSVNLYLLVSVVDDAHVQNASGELLYRGDSLELQFDADLPGDFNDAKLSADDYQLGLSPGFDRQTPEIWLWNPAHKRGINTGIALVTRSSGGAGGYVLEAAIPWGLFETAPIGGQSFGFALNSSDDDSPGTSEQQSMISSVITRRLLDPTTWGTVVLDP